MRSWQALTIRCEFLLWIAAAAVLPIAMGASIPSFPCIGARSHVMNQLRLAEELIARGHTFSLLVSDSDTTNSELVHTRHFPGLNLILFKGDPHIGTEAWSKEFSRDITQVPKTIRCDCSIGSYTAASSVCVVSCWDLLNWMLDWNAQQFIRDHRLTAECLHADNATVQALRQAGLQLDTS